MPVSTDDLRAAVTSLYPDNVGGEIDATEQQGRWGTFTGLVLGRLDR